MANEWLATAAAVLAIMVKQWYTDKKLQEIHVLVNSRLTTALNEIGQLREMLAVRGVELPAATDDKIPRLNK